MSKVTDEPNFENNQKTYKGPGRISIWDIVDQGPSKSGYIYFSFNHQYGISIQIEYVMRKV